MMKGYLDTSNANPTLVTVTGLPASSAGYDVYVYIDGDNPGATRTAAYQISAPGITASAITATDSASTNFSGTFVPANGTAGNYVKFSIQSTGFTLTATPGATTDVYARAPLNGIQIVPSPVPDFSLGGGTSGTSVVVGSAVNYPVSVNALNGFSGPVTLSVAGLPNGATASFSPATVSGSGTATLQITTSTTTPVGAYPLTITGTSGAAVHTLAMQLTVSNAALPTTAISIDFVGLGTPMQPTEVAGVIAKANWNSAAGAASSQPLALKDENGAATAVSVSWTSDNTWSTTVGDVAGNLRMMKGYLDTSNANPTLVTVTGLPASSAGYDVYVYIDGDNPGATRTAAYQITAPGITASAITATDSASTNFSGTFVPANGTAGNYIKFSIQSTGFTLTATPGATTDVYARAPLNGIQIVPSSVPGG